MNIYVPFPAGEIPFKQKEPPVPMDYGGCAEIITTTRTEEEEEEREEDGRAVKKQIPLVCPQPIFHG